jgi:hypothetical protein
MDRDLTLFIAQWARIALMALLPVVLTAFVSMPLILGVHPGEASTMARSVPTDTHLT